MGVDKILTDIDNIFQVGTGPDVLALRNILYYIDGIMSVSLGILLYALIIGLPLVTAIDVLYIIIPPFRNKISEINIGKQGKFKLISKDAVKAIQYSVENQGKSATSKYLWLRMKTHIAVVILVYLAAGGLWDNIVSSIVKFVSIVVAFIFKMTI